MAERNTGHYPITDGLGSDPAAVEAKAGPAGRALLKALDRAVSIQSSSVEKYVNRLRRKKPDASPQEIQRLLDKHLLTVVSGSGAGAGAAAAVPGIGFFTGAAAIGVESLVFLDAVAIYTVASAYLRGVDIQDPERRRALILLVLLGAKGSAIVDTVVGDLGRSKGLPTVATMSRFSAPTLGTLNNRLLRTALKQVGKKFRWAWLGKIMPLGIGAVAGTVANRRLAKRAITNSRESLGTPPATFPPASVGSAAPDPEPPAD